MRARVLALAAVLALLGAPAVARAQPANGASLLRYLLTMAQPERGFLLWEVPAAGSLPQGGMAEVPISLQEGISYTFIWACDQDCTDVDLRLLDPSGAEIERADEATIVVTPRLTGLYRLRLVVEGCSVAPCAYAVGLYRMIPSAPTPLPRR